DDDERAGEREVATRDRHGRTSNIEDPGVDADLLVDRAGPVQREARVALPGRIVARLFPRVAPDHVTEQPDVAGDRRERREPLVAEHVFEARVTVATASLGDRRTSPVWIAEPFDAGLA